MKTGIFIFTITAIAIFSCNTSDKTGKGLMQPGNLKSSFIKISSGNACTLKTPRGAILRIDKNTFSTHAGDEVLLELKEAYTLHDMITGGLVTESNGRLLNSGGMIYINATINNEKTAVLKPVKISIPSDVYDDSMELYKGEMKGDTLNWTNPVPLDTNAEFRQRLAWGKKLFMANCSSCHKPTMDFTGPALAKARERSPDPEWAYRFISRSTAMVQTDPYAIQLKKKYGSVMTAFPLLEKDAIKAILDYCDNEAALNPLPAASGSAEKAPCLVTDTVYVRKLDSNISILSTADTAIDFPPAMMNAMDKEEEYNEGMRNGFRDPNYTKGMYDFEVNTLGWFNVDAGMSGYKGSSLVTVQAKITNSDINGGDMHVYLFCPGKKLLSVAYDQVNGLFTFNKVDGKVPLFINDDAVIFAFTSKAEKMYYAISLFKIQSQQIIPLTLKETTLENMQQQIISNNIEGIRLDAVKKKDIEIISRPCYENLQSDSVSTTVPEK